MDLIYAARYTEVCDYSWDKWKGVKVIPGGIWHVDTASIPEFFETISLPSNNFKEYVVVSPSCDFGVCLQKYNHPAYDFSKWISLQANNGIGYSDLPQLPARINREKCVETDTYSIKCWSYTEATFNEIPYNVKHWFLVNCNIQDERVTPIPFGLLGNKDNLENIKQIKNYNKQKNRDKLLYVNFQFYTSDRFELFKHFSGFGSEFVTCKQKVSFDEYLDDLATHKYVLCPPGNGWDCYRTLETIYMGAIPILENICPCLSPYYKLEYPIIGIPSLYMAIPDVLESSYKNIMENWNGNINIEQAKWPYWEQKIKASVV